MPEAVFNTRDICVVGSVTLADIVGRAEASPRKRFRLCMHRGLGEHVHEMVIALVASTFVQPHRHPTGKSESFHVIRGEMDVFFFDAAGRVVRVVGMGEIGTGKAVLYRLSASLWHMPLPRSSAVVYHEVYEGPFEKDVDVAYAPWAPQEDDVDGVARFVARARAQAAALGDPGDRTSGADLQFLGGAVR